MARFRSWFQAARPLAQANIAIPLLVGEALAWAQTGRVHLEMLIAIHVMGVVDQLAIVFANDVADEEGDRKNDTYTPFSGGSRVLPEGKLTLDALRRAAWTMVAILLATSVGAGLLWSRPWLGGLWGAGLVLLWSYSFSPLRLSYRGWGELAQGLGLGVLLPLIGFYGQAGSFDSFPWSALAPLFLLGFAGNINTALPDAPADAAVDKQTWPVRYGTRRARKHTLQLVALAIVATPLVLRDFEQVVWATVEVPALLLLLVAWRELSRAEPEARASCRRFVLSVGAATHVVALGWSVALIWKAFGG